MGIFLQKLLKGEYGWKTMAGIVLMLVGLAGDTFRFLTPEQVDRLFGLGELVGIFGLRTGFPKIKQAILEELKK